MPRPLSNEHGSALSISLSLKKNGEYIFDGGPENMSLEGKCFISGVLNRVREITAFLNPTTNSYKRFGMGYAPKYVDWSYENSSQLIRIPKALGVSPRIELRSADAACDPYIAFKLILEAGIEGIRSGDCTIMDSTMKTGRAPSGFEPLPMSLEEAVQIAENSDFVRNALPEEVSRSILSRLKTQIQEYNLAKDKDDFEAKTYFMYL